MKSTLRRLIAFLSVAFCVFPASSQAAIHKSILHTFGRGTGSPANPSTNLISDAEGNIYGATISGGNPACPEGCGVVYRLSPISGYSVIYGFTGGTDGGNPLGSIVFDAEGNLYGVTAYGNGGVYRLSSQPDGTWAETTLHAFGGSPDGATPQSGLTMDVGGNLYGTTTSGGGAGTGCVYELTDAPDGAWTESVLYSFQGGTDGRMPVSEVTVDPNGTLYGTTLQGGAYGYGTVYSLVDNAGTWTEAVLFSFQGGRYHGGPEGAVYLDSFGNLIGTTTNDDKDAGTVFKLTHNPDGSWSASVVHSFGKPSDGFDPRGNLSADADGNLYGTTYIGGGAGNNGVLFRLSVHAGGQYGYAVILDFDYTDGANPVLGNRAFFDPAGNLLIATYYGGVQSGYDGYGVILELSQ
jgi:uncharacterized repeat protein (TIGR03803 family)